MIGFTYDFMCNNKKSVEFNKTKENLRFLKNNSLTNKKVLITNKRINIRYFVKFHIDVFSINCFFKCNNCREI